MLNKQAYIKFKNYCDNNTLTVEQVEAITREQVEATVKKEIGQAFFDNVKQVYLRKRREDDYEDAKQYMDTLLAGQQRFPNAEAHKKKVGNQYVIEIWLEGKPMLEEI